MLRLGRTATDFTADQGVPLQERIAVTAIDVGTVELLTRWLAVRLSDVRRQRQRHRPDCLLFPDPATGSRTGWCWDNSRSRPSLEVCLFAHKF